MKHLIDYIRPINESIEDQQNSYPPLTELPNGEYTAMWYAWVFELEDGRKYTPNCGIRRSRRMTSFERYMVNDGNVIKLK